MEICCCCCLNIPPRAQLLKKSAWLYHQICDKAPPAARESKSTLLSSHRKRENSTHFSVSSTTCTVLDKIKLLVQLMELHSPSQCISLKSIHGHLIDFLDHIALSNPYRFRPHKTLNSNSSKSNSSFSGLQCFATLLEKLFFFVFSNCFIYLSTFCMIMRG